MKQAGWRVLLVERRRRPEDKLCGEFLSPDGVSSLRKMELGERLQSGGYAQIAQVGVSSVAGHVWRAQLPEMGLGISRLHLDRLLIERCAAIGVEVVQGVKISQVHGDLKSGFFLEGRGLFCEARTVVGAWGKQNPLKNASTSRDAPSDWMALKLHLSGAFPRDLVELHAFPGGYAGLCCVEEGRVNLCLLTRTDSFKSSDGDYPRFVGEVLCQNSLLEARLRQLEGDWNCVLAVANLSFGSGGRWAGGMALVGDAAGTIGPLCGDGMAMALRAAEIFSPLVDFHLRGERTDAQFLRDYDTRWRAEFRRRLVAGKLLQTLLVHPFWAGAAIGLLRRFPALGHGAIRATRGPTGDAF